MLRAMICFAFLAVLNLTLTTHAGIMPTGVFTGQYSETWESFDNFGNYNAISYLPSNTTILGGIAQIVHPRMVIYEEADPVGYGLVTSGDFAQVSDGIRGMGTDNSQFFPNIDTTARINFLTPVIAFGGYWGGETGQWAPDPAPIEVRFYDVSNNLIGSDTFFYTRSQQFDGLLEWHGWQSTVAIGAIEYTGSFVVNDGLQANTVPEPSSVCVLGALLASHLLRRRKRSQAGVSR